MDHLSIWDVLPYPEEQAALQNITATIRVPHTTEGAALGDPVIEEGASYLSSLPPRAQNLIQASRRLLLDEGFASLRWERIAKEAGEPKAMIRYYFGDSAGLLSALLRVLSEESMEWLLERSASLPTGPERIHVAIQGLEEVTLQPWYLAIFEVLPRVLRDDKLRGQMAQAYGWYREMNALCIGVSPTPEIADDLQALAALFTAAADGIAIQAALDRDHFDAGRVFAMVERAFRLVLEDIGRAQTDRDTPRQRIDGEAPR
jgi:AcrR family transcriptional regulator